MRENHIDMCIYQNNVRKINSKYYLPHNTRKKQLKLHVHIMRKVDLANLTLTRRKQRLNYLMILQKCMEDQS